MIDIMLDSCVFFKMIEYNNFANAYGKRYLGALISNNIKRVEELEEKLTEAFGEKFNEKYKDLTFEEKLDKYKNYATSLENYYKSEIEKYQHLSQGEVLDHKEIVKDTGGVFKKLGIIKITLLFQRKPNLKLLKS